MKMDKIDHLAMGVSVFNIVFGSYLWLNDWAALGVWHVGLGAMLISITIRRMLRG